MCGIVSLYSTDDGGIDMDTLASMRDSMTHRGPDDAGLYIDGSVGLGHRRLSIIDLSSGARQPMSDETGRIWLVFNGEIYNFAELREEFVRRGYRFKTRSDTETILASYVLDGDSFVERLNGIFAFALWDSYKRRLLLVRDRMGVKPLYIWRGKGLVAAASEIKALLAHPLVRRELDYTLVPEYLAFRQFSGHKTLVKGVGQIPPGHMLVFDEAGEHDRRYWALPYCVPDSLSAEEDLDRVEALLCDATRMQMVSDVPLGTFNSGGIDSSLVTAFAAEARADRLNTFSVGFDDPRFDERPYAQLVADKYQTTHRSLVIDNPEYADHLPRVIWHHDEPLSHHHTVQLYLLSRLARQFVTVVLTGEGSDELFAGYPRYRSGAALQVLGPAGRWLGRNLAPWLPSEDRTGFGKAKRALRLGGLGTVVEATKWVADEDLSAVVDSCEPTVRSERLPAYPLNGDLVSRMLEQDQRNYLQALLMRLDKVTMAASLEARVPFLDHRLVELAATIPSTRKLHRWKTKYLIKQVAARRLPTELIYRRKMGFPVPVSAWLRNPNGLGRYLDLLLEPRSLQREYLKRAAVERVVAEHRQGERDHHELLWGLINLELWFRIVLERTWNVQPAVTRPVPSHLPIKGRSGDLSAAMAADRPA